MKLVIFWLLTCLVTVFGLGSANWLFYREMTINGVRCEGLVSDLHPDRHQLVSYSYKVDGKIFYGERQSRIPNSAFKTLHAGDSVVVFYNRAKPEESLLGDPIQIFKSETFAVVLGGVMAATFVSGIVMWRRGSRPN